jgi:beta-N-acetylhexosaminidase
VRQPAQPLLIGIPGPSLGAGFRELIKRIQPGGFILFARNLGNPDQVYELMSQLNSLCESPPLLTIDQEGGRVARLDRFGAASVSGETLGLAGDVGLCRRHGELTGTLLSLLGFNLNLAPVVDFRTETSRDNSLRGRCLGATPEEVVTHAGAFLQGMESRGVRGTLKHFPGYTHCQQDPHGRIPQVTRTAKQIAASELAPYRELASPTRAIMTGHAHFTAWHDEPHPASLSKTIVGDLLREELKFRGLVMTDDLEMGSIAQTYGAARSTTMALEAGNDIALICHNPACYQLAAEALDELPDLVLEPAMKRIATWKSSLPPFPESFDRKRFYALQEEIEALRTEAEQKVGTGSS